MAVPPLALAMVAIGLAAIIAIGISVISIGLATRRQAARLTARWGAIGDALPLPCCVVDRAGRAHYVNAAFAALCPGAGHAPLAALRRHIEAAGPTTSRGAAAGGADDAGADNVGARLAELATAAASGSGGTIAVAVPGPDAGGRPRLLRATAQPLADGAGHVLWTLEPAVGTPDGPDATSPAADDLVAALDQVPIGLYAVDAEGRFQLLNHALATWLGTTRAEVAAADLRLMDFVVPPPGPPPGSPPGPQLGPAPAQTPLAAGSKVVLRARDGTTFEATLTQSPAAGPASWACGLVQQAAVGAIPATDGRRQRAFEAAPMGIVLVTADGRVAESNGAWRAVVAVGSENPAGRPLSAFVAEDEAGRLATWLAQLATGRGAATPLDLTLRAASADGSPRIVTVFAGRMASPSADPDAAGPDPAGPETADAAVDGLVLHFLETTEQKTLEAKFAQGQKMQAVGQLAGGVAHDFNNLLTAMIGFCDLLLLRHSPGDQSFADIMQIKQNAARAANLVRQLLAFSRQQTMQPRVLNITDVLAELSNLLRRLIGAKIELEMAHGRNLDLVRVDQGQLEQVIINLAVNARDAMADGGRLTIRTHNLSLARAERHGSEDVPAGDYVVVEVRDTGVGVAAELRERIFEPFFTTKEVGEGTGLGLSTVYGIVKQTGGFLFLESQPAPAADHGTAFSIYLPGLKPTRSRWLSAAMRPRPRPR